MVMYDYRVKCEYCEFILHDKHMGKKELVQKIQDMGGKFDTTSTSCPICTEDALDIQYQR